MELKVLNGKNRTELGKGFSKRLRKAGRIPGVIYDTHGKATSIDVDYSEFIRLFKSITKSTVVQVKLDNGKDCQAFVKDYQYNMVKDTIEHVDLYEVDADKPLKMSVKVKLEGAPIGVRDGGVLETGLRELELECLPKDLPPRIVVDIAHLGVDQTIQVKDLGLSQAIKVIGDETRMIASIKFDKPTTEAETTEE